MKMKISRGTLACILLLSGAANAAFTDLGDPISNEWEFSTTPADGINMFNTDLVQFSSGGAPSAVNNELFGGTGIVDNVIDPLLQTSTVDQVSLFANLGGTLIDTGIPDPVDPSVNIQYTHTNFLMTNNTGFDFTIGFDWLLQSDAIFDLVPGDVPPALFSFETNPFGSTTGDPADVLLGQLNFEGGSAAGRVDGIDILNGTSFGFTLLTDLVFADEFNNTVASIYNFDVSAPRPPVAAVPEPSTLLLFASGIAGLGISRRKKKPASKKV